MSYRIDPRQQIVPTLLIPFLLITGGCELLGGNDDSSEPQTGSAPQASVIVPKTAERVAEGAGELSYKAREDGSIYLHDATAEKTLFRTPVKKAQRFTIAPSQDRASLDGKDVFTGNLSDRNEHKIYFVPKR